MTTYILTRPNGAVISCCRSCGGTSGPARSDREVHRWQRDHDQDHRREEGRRTPATPTKGRRARAGLKPSPTPTPPVTTRQGAI